MRFLKAFHRFSSTWTGTIIIVLFLIFFVIQSFVIPSGSMKRTMHIGDFLFAKKFSYGITIPTLPWLQIPIVPDFNDNGHLIEGDKPQREDIVIFLFPDDNKIHYVKRCIATGGDEIVYQDKHLYIHFSEGDEYITKNYPANKIKKFNGKLWVDNPYMDKFPGIQYEPDNHERIFRLLMRGYVYGTDGIDMSPIYVKELDGEVLRVNEKPANALYKKVEKGNYYMVGDNRDNSNDSRFWGSVPYKLIIGKPWFIYMSIDWDSYKIRWDRVGTFVEDLQHEEPRY
ncbi:signal peptidase I [Sulfurovum sp. bin170]|uniref:signal peptidase I n=1 Tax=Sulfurovum sp. bin170 TaxID=2695268 RepID=UPI0013DFA06F|nr:signal peptidase I [Sulfurovum sp. bin170]NEW59872.1 signal peptidase I [Sulfurovum sp. bin170]